LEIIDSSVINPLPMARPADPKARNSLLRAAREKFVRHGLKGARIEDITKACGLSKGAFYLHFKSKEALFGQLLREFRRKMQNVVLTRRLGVRAFLEKEGIPTVSDVRQQTPRYLQFIELNKEYDLAVLELCWEYRDLVYVIIRGVQGTAYEGKAWKTLQEALAHLERQQRLFTERGTFRQGVAEGLMPAMWVGTYFMLCFQMVDMKKKPDFNAWAYGMNRLLHEGCTPLLHEENEACALGKNPPARLALPKRKENSEIPLLAATKRCGLGAEKTKRRNS